MEIYEPAEDSYLLQKVVREYANGRVLDIGTGSGIQALTALESSRVRDVLAVDINQNAVTKLKEKVQSGRLRKLRVQESNLFSRVEGKFNTIIFNPPYLPQDEGIEDVALYGGKKGWEVSAKFFSKVSKHLISDGQILFLFSTLTNKEKIEELIGHNLLEFEEVASKKIAFEKLYVYRITKSALLRELEGKLLENVCYFTQGKRGIIYTALLDKNKNIKTHLPSKKNIVKVGIKATRPGSKAEGRIKHEAGWLRRLNKKGIGPRLLFSGEDYFVYPFIEGEFILDWIPGHTKTEILSVLQDVLEQCYTLDSLNVTKEEMHHPQKHILIDPSGKAWLLDFERCVETEKPKNVTQFIEFICRMNKELKKKEISIGVSSLRELAAEYKSTFSRESFADIKRSLQ